MFKRTETVGLGDDDKNRPKVHVLLLKKVFFFLTDVFLLTGHPFHLQIQGAGPK